MHLTLSSPPAPNRDPDRTLQLRPRRQSANATQEVALEDILEVLERGALGDASSTDVTEQLDRAAPRRRHLGWIVVLAVTGSVLILAAAVVPVVLQRASAVSPSARPIHAAAKLEVPPPASEPVATSRSVRVEDLPRAPQTGTVRLAGAGTGHRIFVDGVLVTSPATVECGPHVVRVGAQGRPQRVLVPCGGDVELSSRDR